MFKIIISEPILKGIIEIEGNKPEDSRSFLYKVMKRLKKLYVPPPDTVWADSQKNEPSNSWFLSPEKIYFI